MMNVSDVVKNPHDAAAIEALLPLASLIGMAAVFGIVFAIIVKSAGKKPQKPPVEKDTKTP